MPQKSQEMKKLEDAVSDCHISSSTSADEDSAKEIELADSLDPKLLSKWPKPRMKVPPIFLHKTVDFAQHCKKIIQLGVNFYQPYLGTNYTRIYCESANDHKSMLEYFVQNNLPFHTYGHPENKKFKVIIRGLPKDTDLNKFKESLIVVGIPIVRMHKMHIKEDTIDKGNMLALAIVPYKDEGMKLLQLKKAFGQDVKLEPPNRKAVQCHRCQKWGHSQRYCHGDIKCVKCAGDHLSTKCTRDRDIEPPTCTNCGGNHTASYRECFYCPESTEYRQNRRKKMKMMMKKTVAYHKKRILVTLENHEKLYRKIKNIPKHNEAIPF